MINKTNHLSVFLSIFVVSICTSSSACILGEAISADEFFQTPTGTIAISENCNSSTSKCRSYFVVPNCTAIKYNTSNKRDFSISVNTSATCNDQNCDADSSQEGYVAASFVYKHQSKSNIMYPIEMIRNENWKRGYDYRRKFKKRISQGFYNIRKFENFFGHQSSNSKLSEFDNHVFKFFHAKTSVRGYDSWNIRTFFASAVENAGFCMVPKFCTMKAYLFRFQETKSGVPSSPLRFSGAIANTMGVAAEFRAPIRQGVYNSSIYIEFTRE